MAYGLDCNAISPLLSRGCSSKYEPWQRRKILHKECFKLFSSMNTKRGELGDEVLGTHHPTLVYNQKVKYDKRSTRDLTDSLSLNRVQEKQGTEKEMGKRHCRTTLEKLLGEKYNSPSYYTPSLNVPPSHSEGERTGKARCWLLRGLFKYSARYAKKIEKFFRIVLKPQDCCLI